jgi:hypothetical protein
MKFPAGASFAETSTQGCSVRHLSLRFLRSTSRQFQATFAAPMIPQTWYQ